MALDIAKVVSWFGFKVKDDDRTSKDNEYEKEKVFLGLRA
jgi:hypothetical protein